MQPTVMLALAHRRAGKTAERPASPPRPAPRAVRGRPSVARKALRVLAVVVGGLVLVLSLVDPLHGNDGFEAPTASVKQEARHG
jgi:hypothetical protein